MTIKIFSTDAALALTSLTLKRPIAVALTAVVLASFLHPGILTGQVTTYRSAINVNILGTEGKDFVTEDLYYDRPVADHRVVYIKAATQISMETNGNNIAGNPNGKYEYVAAAPEVGIIKFKPDGDLRRKVQVADWETYAKPFSFSDLNYGMFGQPGISVVGSTGDGGATRADNDNYIHYGIEDETGEEWHTLAVAHDDADGSGGRHGSFEASDGKMHLFVVNPNACISWAVTGDAKYHTSPPKHYFLPHIFSQETRFETGDSGTVEATIRSLYGENVFHRIVSDPGDAVTAYTDAGADVAVLGDADFAGNGVHYLQFYCGAANAAKMKTRKVLKNPAYPSAGETHGDRLWIDAAHYASYMHDKLHGDWWMEQWRTSNYHNNHAPFATQRRTGMRNFPGSELKNAIVARVYGMTAKRSSGSSGSFAEFAKYALMESMLSLDTVGMELGGNFEAGPTRELSYRGYWDVGIANNAAFTYDILIGHFRKNQGHKNGITPVEDYFLRDMLARWVHFCGLTAGGVHNDTSVGGGGMWDTARKIGAAFVCAMMPSYSTPYYGTSGLDGNTEVYTEVVFPTLNHTWFDLFLDNSVQPDPIPGRLKTTMGVDETLWTSDGTWDDKVQYANLGMMGKPMGIYYNLLKLFHPTKTLPRYDLAMTRAAAGTLRGTKLDSGSIHKDTFYSWAHLQNAWHPDFRKVAQPEMLSRTESSDPERLGRQAEKAGVWFLIWYNHELPLGKDVRSKIESPPAPPANLRIMKPN